MKNQVQNKFKIIALVWAMLGVLFIIGGIAMCVLRDTMTQLPRVDIAHIGFWVVGAIFLIVAITVYCMRNDKNTVIEEKDERLKAIANKAGNRAYMVQTVLLSVVLFLLCFMGYMNAVAMITLMSVIIISVLFYILSVAIYNRKM